jgi:hypothetical protein
MISVYKKRHVKGSYLVDENNKKVAISFKQWLNENGYNNYVYTTKRAFIKKFIESHSDQTFFIQYGRRELYLTNAGVEFMDSCPNALSANPKVINVDEIKKKQEEKVVKRQTVEQLDTGKDDAKEMYETTDSYVALLTSLSHYTNNPFSITKCFYNPFYPDKRVIIDLYRHVNDVHEGYILLGGNGTLHSAKTYVMDGCKYAVMNGEYGDKAKLYIVAPSFDKDALTYYKYNMPNCECLLLSEMMRKVLGEVAKYYDKKTLIKIANKRNWYKTYSSLVAASGVSLSTILGE